MGRQRTALMVALVIGIGGSMSDMAEEVKPGVLRTPDERFENLKDYSFTPNYAEVEGFRVHYVDEGPKDATPVLLMHGEPSWSYLYRHMIPVIVDAGYRAIAPDLVGFGKSDKPMEKSAHSYQLHVDVMNGLVSELDLNNATMFCQDWGGLIGLRVVTDQPDRFARVVAANTGLPEGAIPDGYILGGEMELDESVKADDLVLAESPGFMAWLKFSQTVPAFPSGMIVQGGSIRDLSAEEVAAYEAPFPDESFKAGPRVMPTLIMSQATTNQQAWKVLEAWEKPFLTLFSDGDPITKGQEKMFQSRIPGAMGQPHQIIEGGGHFLQEDKGKEIAALIVKFIKETS